MSQFCARLEEGNKIQNIFKNSWIYCFEKEWFIFALFLFYTYRLRNTSKIEDDLQIKHTEDNHLYLTPSYLQVIEWSLIQVGGKRLLGGTELLIIFQWHSFCDELLIKTIWCTNTYIYTHQQPTTFLETLFKPYIYS